MGKFIFFIAILIASNIIDIWNLHYTSEDNAKDRQLTEYAEAEVDQSYGE